MNYRKRHYGEYNDSSGKNPWDNDTYRRQRRSPSEWSTWPLRLNSLDHYNSSNLRLLYLFNWLWLWTYVLYVKLYCIPIQRTFLERLRRFYVGQLFWLLYCGGCWRKSWRTITRTRQTLRRFWAAAKSWSNDLGHQLWLKFIIWSCGFSNGLCPWPNNYTSNENVYI